MKFAKVRRSFILATSLTPLLFAGAAQAQESGIEASGSESEPDNNVILVTAQFREQELQDTPLAITAVTGEMLQARSQTNIADVANQAPSVTLKNTSATFGPSLGANIRGVGQFDPSPAVEPGVGIYVDDVYYASLTGAVLDLLDLERVEILRGPQGTLAGRNALGGAIKLYSRKPDGNGGGYVQATYGSRDRLDLRAGFDFALTDSLFGRIAGVSKMQDGYVTRLDFGCVNPPGSALNPETGGIQPRVSADVADCELGKLGSIDTQAVRGQLRFDNGGPLEINLIADYTNERRTPAGEVLVLADNAAPWIRGDSPAVPLDGRFICGRFCNYASYHMPGGPWPGPVGTGFPIAEFNAEPRADYEGWGLSGQANWDISDRLNLVSITAYRAYNSHFTTDVDLTPLAISANDSRIDFWSFSQELRLNGSVGENHFLEYTIGGYYLDQRTIYAPLTEIRYVPFPGQFQQNDPVDADSKAVFGQILLHPTDTLTLIGGLRYTKESKDYEFYRRTVTGEAQPFFPFDGVIGSYKGDRVDYRAGIQYRFNSGIMAYGQISTGFKGGGINPRPFTEFQVVPFEPETLTSYEIGLKSDLFGGRARVNLAAFYSDYKDIQMTLLSCPQFSDPDTPDDDNGPCAANFNAGDGRIKGVEMEVSAEPIDYLSFDAALSYLDFEYTSINPLAGGPDNPLGPQFDDVTPYTPKWKWSIGAQYRIELGRNGSLTPRIDASYQSDVYSNPANNPFELVPAYTMVNARLTWRNNRDDLAISAEVKNLFDKYYSITAYDSSNAGFATLQPGQPREWAVSVRKEF